MKPAEALSISIEINRLFLKRLADDAYRIFVRFVEQVSVNLAGGPYIRMSQYFRDRFDVNSLMAEDACERMS